MFLMFCCSFDATPRVNSVLKVCVYFKIYFWFSDISVQLRQIFPDIIVRFVHSFEKSVECLL